MGAYTLSQDIVSILLQAGANDEEGLSVALVTLTSHFKYDSVKQYLQAGVNPNAVDYVRAATGRHLSLSHIGSHASCVGLNWKLTAGFRQGVVLCGMPPGPPVITSGAYWKSSICLWPKGPTTRPGWV